MANATPDTKKRKALTDIWTFADIIGFHGGKEKFSSIHFEMSDFLVAPQTQKEVLDKQRRRLMIVARGHLKSTLLILYVLWRVYRNPNIRILMATNLKRLARSFIRELRQYFEDDELQRTVWNARPHIEGLMIPALDAAGRRKRGQRRDYDEEDETNAVDKKIIWNAEALQVVRPGKFKEPTILATSVGTTVTGDHYDLIILDDIVDFKNSDTTGKRDKIYEWTQDLDSVLDPLHEETFVRGRTKFTDMVGEETITTGTRYFGGDYYDVVLTNQEEQEYVSFIRNVYANGIDASSGFTYPEKFNERVVNLLQKRLTTRRYAAQYLNQIVNESGAVFEWERIKWLPESAIEIKDRRVFVRFEGKARPVEVRPVLAIDPAVSQKGSADFTAIAVGGYDFEQNFYLFDLTSGRFTPSETTDIIFKFVDKWGLAMAYVDVIGLGATFPFVIKQAAQRLKRRPIVIHEYKPRGDKEERIQDILQPLFTNDQIYALAPLKSNNEFKLEVSMFPLAAHDDVLDVLAIAAEVANPTRQNVANKRRTKQPPKRIRNRVYGGTR
jgi:predicted phage terminase large subunit-like protein